MKTSNKLLLILFGLLVGVSIAGMVYIRFFELKKADAIIGNNEMVEDQRELSSFHTLDIQDNIEIVLRKGDPAVVVHGESNLVENVITEAQNNTLKIYRKKGILLKSNQPLYVLVQSPELQEIKLTQASKARCEDTLVGQELKLVLTGAAEADILSAYSTYDITMSGAAAVNLTGQGNALHASLSGASKMNARHLICNEVTLEGDGASSANVHAQNALHVQLSGACNVRYQGNVQDVRSQLTGASTLDRE